MTARQAGLAERYAINVRFPEGISYPPPELFRWLGRTAALGHRPSPSRFRGMKNDDSVGPGTPVYEAALTMLLGRFVNTVWRTTPTINANYDGRASGAHR